MIWKKNIEQVSHWKVKVDFILRKKWFNLWCIVYIEWRHFSHIIEKLTMKTRVLFQHVVSTCTYVFSFLFFYKLLVYRGFNFIMTQTRHSSFQWRVGGRCAYCQPSSLHNLICVIGKMAYPSYTQICICAQNIMHNLTISKTCHLGKWKHWFLCIICIILSNKTLKPRSCSRISLSSAHQQPT